MMTVSRVNNGGAARDPGAGSSVAPPQRLGGLTVPGSSGNADQPVGNSGSGSKDHDPNWWKKVGNRFTTQEERSTWYRDPDIVSAMYGKAVYYSQLAKKELAIVEMGTPQFYTGVLGGFRTAGLLLSNIVAASAVLPPVMWTIMEVAGFRAYPPMFTWGVLGALCVLTWANRKFSDYVETSMVEGFKNYISKIADQVRNTKELQDKAAFGTALFNNLWRMNPCLFKPDLLSLGFFQTKGWSNPPDTLSMGYFMRELRNSIVQALNGADQMVKCERRGEKGKDREKKKEALDRMFDQSFSLAEPVVQAAANRWLKPLDRLTTFAESVDALSRTLLVAKVAHSAYMLFTYGAL